MLITFADQSLFVKVLLLNTCKDFTFLFDFFSLIFGEILLPVETRKQQSFGAVISSP